MGARSRCISIEPLRGNGTGHANAESHTKAKSCVAFLIFFDIGALFFTNRTIFLSKKCKNHCLKFVHTCMICAP
ncbi:hypothetical protein CY34DRAFT_709623 [Suillus luteus UH-Slu-Lm8-n1]|uniref:Uncharacterized protein n=1 Tax=Suillus luteus UH-Slu-Lm8-n1 TaxID=930992 RepID=A0A0D0A0N7_9AGAM|nr:hypothetical protein CY34DRAFT_709623 [Suillus luteus UH-Slu-Lm8-n1]